MTGPAKDRFLGVLVSIFSLAYIWYARSIEDSMLADSVGAGGVPLAIGIVLFIASAALVIKSFFVPESGPDEPSAAEEQATGYFIPAALVAMLVAYVLLVPVAGYIVSVSLLVFAVAVLAKAPLKPVLFISAALSGLIFWALFELALSIHMPRGMLFS